MSPLSIQLWSYNYDPEPTGIGPVSTVWAQAMAARGHQVSVVAAHPHYPEPRWGHALRPYRERRDGIPVLRLPLWIGRDTGAQRIRQDASFAAALTAALPALGSPDVIVAVSPSFPALVPAMLAAQLRRVPWILWLQDILPDGAAATGLLENRLILEASRQLERAAYRSASKIVVISDTHHANLRAKGVPPDKLERIFNPATQQLRGRRASAAGMADPPKILSMGNIGHSQGLAPLVRAFEASEALAARGVRLLITGDGIATEEVRREIRSGRVELTGVVSEQRLSRELNTATVGLVSQRDGIAEFNLPSKLMNFMARGVPVLACVPPEGEVARLVQHAGAGWVAPASDSKAFEDTLLAVLSHGQELERRAAAGIAFATTHFTPGAVAASFEEACERAVTGSRLR